MNIGKEREAFEAVWLVPHELGFFEFKDNQYVLKDNYADDSESPIANETYHSLNSGWSMWLKAKADEAKKLEGCVVVPKDQTEDWYLDPDEYMWFERDGIDGTLCDMYIGEVKAIEHKEYLITLSDTLYAAIVWDHENQDSGTWEFFKTEEEAEKAAAHCKAMVDAARGGK
ncbi:hypothetical protein [Acinetobacter colistiniresistens]|uniref:hypothetical protein n=1 Tax=Acinetobacter colistiniresistens TaxID=280145 RepID=UPI001250AFEF|nr:hypothetical protein [Acinetobacter colistiniresistens]